MRTDALHRRLAADVQVIYDGVSEVFPVHLPHAYESHQMNVRQFIDRLNKAVEPCNVFNDVRDDASMKKGSIVLSGLWIAQSELPERGSEADVRVLWHMHPDTKRIQWSPYYWGRRRFYFWQLLMHEIIHRHQPTSNTNRDPRVYKAVADTKELKEEQEYLGNTEEIETHAHDAAVEMFVWWPHLTYRQSILAAREVKGPTPPTILHYESIFENCPSHPAMKHFMRKLRSWYDTVRKNADFYQSLELAKIV